jgi:hypothetical protein
MDSSKGVKELLIDDLRTAEYVTRLVYTELAEVLGGV